jgi:hypothetical protein
MQVATLTAFAAAREEKRAEDDYRTQEAESIIGECSSQESIGYTPGHGRSPRQRV